VIGPDRRTRRASPTQVNDPVTITAPTGGTVIDQQWRDAARLRLDQQHPASINTDPSYVS
jgi:hypothetical protein